MASARKSLRNTAETVPVAEAEDTLQKIAEKLGVNYYADFEVVQVRVSELIGRFNYYFPMAEVYEKGRWRKVIIGGRPYRSESMANSVKEDSETAQGVFLRAFADVKTPQCFRLSGLSNPIEHWEYELEL
ncbi:MAG: hypothetical protein A2942_01340 [Candidatus Lloydbacteria bacterium RIFCSPLOWO2_01_FULL_50_20]|uniref:Uncharacterized protein n=1 Tax=Candidatus Lloydbacteria bacterium RIFCSPLOWO2_01_FULL_50_20 TaxID=1798665 RepID=A0A1G2DIN4_9BACT|nr:MAG: hypothetical protein A2942_01340 [Candidatus Lloydbacteria bacterium RIFCSPLOWO2_01_FULL_50_20]